jgi:hypothetical protein
MPARTISHATTALAATAARKGQGDDLVPYVSFLRQRKTARDTLFEPRYVYNIFQTCNTFLRANGILFAGEILGQLDYEEKEVKPYKAHELKASFQAADDEEKLWMSYLLNTGCREQEVANAHIAICSMMSMSCGCAPSRAVASNSRESGGRTKDAVARSHSANGEATGPHDRESCQAKRLIFPNTIGGVEGHPPQTASHCWASGSSGTGTSPIPKIVCRHYC